MELTKPIKVSWIAPNGKNYEDVIPMTLQEYSDFVNNMLKLKQRKGPQEMTPTECFLFGQWIAYNRLAKNSNSEPLLMTIYDFKCKALMKEICFS